MTEIPSIPKTDKILNIEQVQEITGLSPSSIRRREAEGDFPQRGQLGIRCRRVGYWASEIYSYLQNLPRR
jgi:predicted DNA-binding transcriptional regulator AlpA